MNLSSLEQYSEVLSQLPKPPTSTNWEKYDRYELTSKVLHNVFTSDAWNEWDLNLGGLRESYEKKLNPTEYDKNYNLVHAWKYPTWFLNPQIFSRETSYLIMAFQAFGNEKIEEYLLKNRDILFRVFSEDDLVKFGGWWSNACETGRHIFQNFQTMLWRWNPEPKDLDIREVRRLMQSSAMLDTPTFNRFSIRNFCKDIDWVLRKSNPDGMSDSYLPWERIGCPAVRRFRWLERDTTVFDELFARICIIYGYTGTDTTDRTIATTNWLSCPFHHQDTSVSSLLPSVTSRI